MLMCIIVASILAAVVAAAANTVPKGYTYSPYTFGKLDHHIKKASQDVLVGGRFTSRQVSGIAESGFSTLVTISDFPTDDPSYNGVPGDFPSSAGEQKIFESYGLNFVYNPMTWNATQAKEFSQILSAAAKPVYVHCHGGFEASVFTTLHLYLTNQITADQIVPNGIKLGFNFLSAEPVVSLINEVVPGLNLVYDPTPQLELSLTNKESSYKTYYWPHRVGNDTWYNLGQVLSTQVEALQVHGFKSVISLRPNGEATTRLSTDPTTGAVANDEFSDENGLYSVALEEAAVTTAGLKFYNLPVESSTAWTNTVNFYDVFTPALQEAEQLGPVLIHCASGYRSSGYLTTYLALQKGLCTDWALQQAANVGFSFDQSSSDAAVVSFMKSILKC